MECKSDSPVKSEDVDVEMGDRGTSLGGSETHNQFKASDIPTYSTVMFYGARHTGKTRLATYLMHKTQDRYDHVYLMSETIKFQPDQFTWLPEKNKRGFYDESLLKYIFKEQEKEISKAKKLLQHTAKKNGEKMLTGDELRDKISEMVPHVMLILDDIINDPRIRTSKLLSKIFISGRHLRISFWILSQSPAKSAVLSRIMRCNVDIAFVAELDSQDDLETVQSIFFNKEGKKKGVERLQYLTSTQYSFAVSKMFVRPKRGLLSYTSSFKAPEFYPDPVLKDVDNADKLGKKAAYIGFNPHAHQDVGRGKMPEIALRF